MKRLLTLALVLLLAEGVCAFPGPYPRAEFFSPRLKYKVTEGLDNKGEMCQWPAGASMRLGPIGPVTTLGTIDSECCLVSDTGNFVAVAQKDSLRLVSRQGKTLARISVTPYFGLQFIGGWLEDDGSSYWESKRGELWSWNLKTHSLEKVKDSLLKSVLLSPHASPMSSLRLAVSNRIELPADAIQSQEKLLRQHPGGDKVLELYQTWLVGRTRQQVLALLAEKKRQSHKEPSSRKTTHTLRMQNILKEMRGKQAPPPDLQLLLDVDQYVLHLPPWLVSESELKALEAFAVDDFFIQERVAWLHSLRPDIPVSQEFIVGVDKMLTKVQRRLMEGMNAPEKLENAEPLFYIAPLLNRPLELLLETRLAPERLTKLLRVEFPGHKALLEYYFFVGCPQAVPGLIELLPAEPLLARRALLRQLRVDLGDETAAWKKWTEQPHHDPVERGRKLLSSGDGSGLLWLGRDSAQARFVGESVPRLVQRISTEEAGALWVDHDRVGRKTFRSPIQDWYWELPSGRSRWPLREPDNSQYSVFTRPGGEYLIDCFVRDGRNFTWWKGGIQERCNYGDTQVSPGIRSLLDEQKASGLACTRMDSESTTVNGQHPLMNLEQILDPKTGAKYSRGLIGGSSSDGRWCALLMTHDSGPTETAALMWDSRTSSIVPGFAVPSNLGWNHQAEVLQTFSPDSRWLAIGTEKLILVSTAGDAPHTMTTQAIKAKSLAFQPKAERLAVGMENELVLMHLPDLKVEQIIRGLGPVNGLAYSPDGSLLAVALQDEIRVYQTNSPWPTQAGQDAQLLSELWTGMRLSGGAAVRLSEVEFKQRLKRWKSETGSDWWDGCPRPAGLPTLPLAALAICGGFLGYSFWSRRRS